MKAWLTISFLASTVALSSNSSFLKDTPSFYQSSGGTLYTHPAMPLSLFLGNNTKPDSGILLTAQKRAKSVFLNQHGQHSLNLKDGSKMHQFSFFVDAKAPKVTFHGSQKGFQTSKGLIYGPNLSISLKAKDRDSGVKEVKFRTSGGSFSTYTGEIAVPNEGEQSLAFFGRDRVGNTSPFQVKRFIVDKTPPRSKVTFFGVQKEGDIALLAQESTATLSSADSVAGVRKIVYRLQRNNVSLRSGDFEGKPIRMKGLKQGEYQLKFFAVDNVGNREKEQVFRVYVDIDSPNYKLAYKGDHFLSKGRNYVSPRTKIEVIASDNRSGIKQLNVSVNQQPFRTYKAPLSAPGRQGQFSLRASGMDKVSNKSEKKFSNLFLDRIPPSVKYKFTGPHYKNGDINYISSKTRFEISAKDNDAGLKEVFYKSAAKKSVYKTPLKFTQEGFIPLQPGAIDRVNNNNQLPEIKIFNDTTKPEIFVRFSNQSIGKMSIKSQEYEVYPTNTSIFISATDKHSGVSGIRYQINKNRITVLKEAWVPLNTEGSFEITVFATDRVGNEQRSSYKVLVRNPDLRAH